MDIKQHLLKRKRSFDEDVQQYKGPDPLKLRCDFFNWLDNYSKEDTADIYFTLLEETLNAFIEDPAYKQDLRYIKLWLSYSKTQPNPADVLKNIHSKGLGTECAILYSSWAEHLVKAGLISNAFKVLKMGLKSNIVSKDDLQRQYDDFLKDIGQKLLLGEICCPKCGNTFKVTDECNNEVEKVKYWEWNPLKVGEKDDFKCPVAYFEEHEPNKIRMYPKHKVYPGNDQEFSLEEIMAMEYEKRYEEERLKAEALAREEERRRAEEAEAMAREEERRRVKEELRWKEGEKSSVKHINPPVQASIPLLPKLQLPKEVDNSAVNSTTFTAHMKEAMNVVQDMWSSPAPSDPPRALYTSEKKPDCLPTNTPRPFEIYTEEEPPSHKPIKTPFQIFDENSMPRKPPSSTIKSQAFDVYDENAPPETILTKQPSTVKPKTPFSIFEDNEQKTPSMVKPEVPQTKRRVQLFKEEAADLVEKFENQARIQPPPMFNVRPERNEDLSDVTCNTKAFEFILPSSTPLANQKKSHSLMRSEEISHKLPEHTNLSVIFEQSKDKSGNSSTSSVVSQPKSIQRADPVLPTVREIVDPFNPELLEELLDNSGFPKPHHLERPMFIKETNLPTGNKSMKLGEESFNLQGEIGKGAYARVIKATNSRGMTVALKIEKPACRWEYYIAREIQARVPPQYAAAFMDINAAYIYNNGSILETHYAKYGTLFSNINASKERTGRNLDCGVVLHFAIELIDIVDFLHKSKIIHADMKPDNVVLRELPSHDETEPCLQLIDFGRCIDMSLFPPDTKFKYIFKSEDNKCIEMKENRSWTYQIDLQGLASIFHCLLITEYMKVVKKHDCWQLQKPLPRNLKSLWNPIFDSLLNVNPDKDLPFNFGPMRAQLVSSFESSRTLYLQNIKSFRNIIVSK